MYQTVNGLIYLLIKLKIMLMMDKLNIFMLQELKLEMYLQTSPTAPIAMTQPENLATVSFDRHDAENNAIHATLSPVELMGADGKKVAVQGGQIVAVIRNGAK